MRLYTFLAAGLGAGYAPRAPGTVGALLGLATGCALLAASPYLLAAFTLCAGFGGVYVIAKATGLPPRPDRAASDDPSWVVLDEVAGQALALLALPRPTWAGALIAFGLFRLFDIAKPGPVGWADRQGGAWGIMADDLIAGFAACILTGGAHAIWPGFV